MDFFGVQDANRNRIRLRVGKSGERFFIPKLYIFDWYCRKTHVV
jgi:hypothetical protein